MATVCKLLVALVFWIIVQPGNVLAQTFDDTIDPLETAINDLQSALDDVESARSSAEDDPGNAVKAIREAQRKMRSTAISLLLASTDPQRRLKEYQRTRDALRILEPKAFIDQKSH
jgi:type II secretory pathway component PulM